uniref:cytochrome c oxidase subunit III n=1 Tax=Neucentropus mandjuricus TaxID=1223783 RepID=UPI002115B72E|nr:cytochrome c oxidase subunit III [Neucentropus mandjuricus]USL48461.1 cytochrome c oxidase subunit III [Neucentropus mandjuricus]
MKLNHPFHLVNYSPWPLTGSMGTMIMMMGITKMFHKFNFQLMFIGIIIIILTMFQWWRDIIRESTYQGYHNKEVNMNMKWGMALFILSEVMFFLSFFWAFFHSSLSPTIDIGMNWPPKNIETFNPFQIPLLNSIILISSGITVTWTHYSILKNNKNKSVISLMITIFLGIYFTLIQSMEYNEATFSLNDSVYGTTFFVTTGFHGLHVIIGTTMLSICLIRLIKNQFSSDHHFGLEASIWYWHFVDVIWLFLFVFMYWWS